MPPLILCQLLIIDRLLRRSFQLSSALGPLLLVAAPSGLRVRDRLAVSGFHQRATLLHFFSASASAMLYREIRSSDSLRSICRL